jgi:hypothetical protein
MEFLINLSSCPDRQLLNLLLGEIAVAVADALFELPKFLQGTGTPDLLFQCPAPA